jgi:hypothetical protein
MSDENIVNLGRARDDRIQAEIEAEIDRILVDFRDRGIDVVKANLVGIFLLSKLIAGCVRDEAALEEVLRGTLREVRQGARHFYAKRRLKELEEGPRR